MQRSNPTTVLNRKIIINIGSNNTVCICNNALFRVTKVLELLGIKIDIICINFCVDVESLQKGQ